MLDAYIVDWKKRREEHQDSAVGLQLPIPEPMEIETPPKEKTTEVVIIIEGPIVAKTRTGNAQ